MFQHLRVATAGSLIVPLLWLLSGCSWEKQSNAQPYGGAGQEEQPPLVDVAIATSSDKTEEILNYTGTTKPLKTVVLRSRVEGQLLALNADVGQPVQQGQLLATVEANVLTTEVNEARAELAARQFEVKEAESKLAEVKAQVAQNQASLKQAQADAQRFKNLANSGAIAIQQAEVASTNQDTAAQILKSSQEQVATQQQAIAATKQRVAAQQAILAQAQERLTYTKILAPQNGVVLAKNAEVGDILQTGQTLLEIGDLSAIKVEVQISDRDLQNFAPGKQVQVQLDAFPSESFSGQVTRMSPVADAAARLIPIEITIPNPNGNIASGLLARLSQGSTTSPTTSVKIPVSALKVGQTKGDHIFVPITQGDTTTVQIRSVTLGTTDNGMVEILSGLNPGEKYILQGDRPLETGQTVRLSLLSDS